MPQSIVTNHAPIVGIGIADREATSGRMFSFTLPADAFADSDAGDTLALSATLASGEPLPPWLSFDGATRVFSGTPIAASAGPWNLRVTATDSEGASVSDDFVVDVANHIVGTAAADVLTGTGLRDVIEGFNGNDTLAGGASSDWLSGGAGDDVYVFNRGDGAEFIDNRGAGLGADLIRLGADITPADVSFAFNQNYLLSISGTDDSIRTDADLTSLPRVVFADGTVWDRATLLSMATGSAGTEGNDLLVSTAANNLLDGGAGDDTYFVGNNPPNTHIVDGSGTDTLILDGINLADIALGVGSLKITVTATGQEIHLDDFDPDDPYAAGGIEYFQFADGTVLSKADLIDALGFHPTGTNGDDLLSGTSLNDVIAGLEGDDTISGRGGNDLLEGGSGDDSYVYSAGDGHDRIADQAGIDRIVLGDGILPSQLVVTRDNGEVVLSLSDTDSIRFAENAPGSYAVEQIEFADGAAWQAADILRALSRTPPTVAMALSDQTATEDAAFQFTVPAGSFADADAVAGDVLTYAASLADGSPLPNWLAFDVATQSFSGTPGNEHVGSLDLTVTATDRAGTSVSSSFRMSIGNTNDAPTGTVDVDGTATQGQTLTASNTLADMDGLGSIGYQWQSSMDGTTWNNIGDATGSSFTLSEAQVGQQMRAIAGYIDGHGTAESVASTATSAIANVNDAPTGVVTVSGAATQNETLVATHTIGDVDGLGPMYYQWQFLNEGVWWDIQEASENSFTLTEAQVGRQIRVMARYVDGHNAIEMVASDATNVVANVNDMSAGTVTLTGGATQNQTLTASNTLTDADGLGSIGYQWQSSTDGATWSDIGGATASTFTLSEAQVGRQVRAVAGYTDGHGTAESVASAATTAIANVNDAPTVGAGITAVQATEDAAFEFVVPEGAFSDVDAGDSLAYTATVANGNPLPAWLSFDPATRTFSGTPANADVGNVAVSVTATDAVGASAVQVFDLGVINTNDAPLLAASLASAQTTTDTLFSWTLPAGAFVDPDSNDVLGYSARLADGSPLPAWLSIDAATGALAGTPGAGDAGELSLQLVATDGSGATAVGTLTLTVEPLIRDGQTLIGTRQADTLTGTAYNDVFDGRAGADTLIGLGGDDLYLVTDKKDHIVETANGGFDAVWADTGGYTLPDQVEVLALIGGDDYAGSGNGLGNLLVGNRGDNRLDGLAGDDLLRGLAGDDRLLGGAGRDALDGGSGEDVLEDGDDAGFLAGGGGDDRLRLGRGADVIAFNRGDDADRIEGGDGQNDTLSLGGGIRVGDIRLKKTGRDLIVDTGRGDTLRFDDWYQTSGSRSVSTLQVATDASGTLFARYDFAALVRQFDSVFAAHRRSDAWTPGSEAARFQLGDATSEVAGGSLAAAYASSGTLAEVRPETVSAALAAPRSDATASDTLPDVPLPPPPTYHHGQHEDHDEHGDHGYGRDDRHDRDGRHGRHGGPGESGQYLSPREVAAAWQSWQQQAASSPSASPIDYAMGWARLRDRLAGRFEEGEWGGAWSHRAGAVRQDSFSLSTSGAGGFASGSGIGLPGTVLKPLEGLREGFERLHGA